MPPKARPSTSKIHVDAEDDERTQVSKAITWILRRGAAGVGINVDDKGWVKVADLSKYEKLQGQSTQALLQVIDQSNTKKARYQLSQDRTLVRAFDKEERKTINDQYTDPQAAAAVAQMSSGYPGYWPQVPYPMMSYMSPFMGMGWQQAASVMGGGRYEGRIKSFNAEKGFGFIECEQTMALYGRDVFVHKAQVGDLPRGSWVSFVLEMNKSNMPQAKDLQPISGFYASQAEGKGGKGKGKGKGKDGEKGQKKGEGEGKKKGKDDKDKDKGKDKNDKDSEDKTDEKNPADETAKAPEATAEAPKA